MFLLNSIDDAFFHPQSFPCLCHQSVISLKSAKSLINFCRATTSPFQNGNVVNFFSCPSFPGDIRSYLPCVNLTHFCFRVSNKLPPQTSWEEIIFQPNWNILGEAISSSLLLRRCQVGNFALLESQV